MTIETIITIVVSLLGGGGIATIVTALVNKNKNKSDIIQSNIDTALKLQESAIREAETAQQKLDLARSLLDEVQSELRNARRYIDMITDILDENNLPYETYKEFLKKNQ